MPLVQLVILWQVPVQLEIQQMADGNLVFSRISFEFPAVSDLHLNTLRCVVIKGLVVHVIPGFLRNLFRLWYRSILLRIAHSNRSRMSILGVWQPSDRAEQLFSFLQ